MELLRKLARSIWLRLLVSAGLLAFVASRIDLGGARDRFSAGSWGWFVAAAVAMFASFVVGAARWRLYLDAADIRTSSGETLRAYLIGTFANNFLPSQLGGDVARAWIAGSPGSRLRSATTVVVDRATALACLIGVGWIVVAANPGPVPGQLLAALGAASAAFVVAGGAVLVLRSWRVLKAKVPRRFVSSAGQIGYGLAGCLEPGVLGRTFVIGLGFQGLVGLAAWLVARSISLEAPFSVIAASLAPVLIVSALPISIGGFGVREGSYVLLLGYAGVSSTDATLFSLIAAAAAAVASLPGGLVLLRRPELGSDPRAVRLATGRWRIKRPVAEVLRRLGLLPLAFRTYESFLALDPQGLVGRRHEETGGDGLPIPPRRLRVRAGPAAADATFFLETGAVHAALVADAIAGDGSRIEDVRALLDFGCGCGRVTRHWRDLENAAVHGCDISVQHVEWCRRNLPFGEFVVNALEPPLAYPESSFGLAYAFSVFTHLPLPLQERWMAEFRRVVRPGGHLFFTTHGEPFLDRLTSRERACFAAGEQVVLYEEGAGTGLCSVYTPQAFVENVLARGWDYVGFFPAQASGQDAHLLRR